MRRFVVGFISVIFLLAGCFGTFYGLKTDMPLILAAGMSLIALAVIIRLVFGRCPHCGASTLFNNGRYCKECKRKM